MHTTEFLIENGFDMQMKAEDELTVTITTHVDLEDRWESTMSHVN